MSGGQKHISHGFGAVRPYLYGYPELAKMVKEAFGAEELDRLPAGNGFHVEARIGDSMIVMELSDPPHPGGKPASIYVYVPDVDAAYRRALECGASPVSAPEQKPYQERAGGVKDRFGNIWYLATYTG
ncbi:MAG TPA: VOC family protein [Candidatus Binataceae bacterium]|nr:VOC family protein [Candidatus Binataceae bacterium]